ncbi:MAG: hypothetical protein V4437_02465 [Patescibacteria group bacterium]
MKKFTTLIVSLLLLGVAITLFVFLVTRITTFTTVIAKAKESSAAADMRDTALQNASALIADTAPARAELATFIVQNSDSIRIIDAVESAAKREKVTATIGSVTVLPTKWQYHEPVQVIVSARGSFATLARFAAALEALPEASRIENISLEASTNHSWFGRFTIDFVKEKSVTP